MTSKPNNRRPLSFPAVHPCEAISPATLFTSLVTLSQNICNHQSKFFPSQRRNARETTRQIAILLIFFQEIRDRSVNLPNDVVLCFSELHLTFQKVHFLLQDCAREDARLWMLMKCQYVSTQFRTLFRTIATALDVLPLHSIDVCREVKELVELVTKQARKAKFELDANDEREAKRVGSMLQQFERGMEPDMNAMKRVLDYLEIKSWSDCNKEVQFIEEETMRFESCDSEEREVQLMSSLMGFLCYCRVVIFETPDFRFRSGAISEQSQARCSTEMLSCVKPEDFRCPISLELMTDPVTVSTGQTYDRASIQKWLKAGNMICPKTGERLTTPELVPNTTLKKLIQQFCADRGICIAKTSNRTSSIARTIEPGSAAAAHSIQFLSWFLARRLVFGTDEQKTKAAYEIRFLARNNIFNRACLVEMGTVPPLLDLLSSRDKTAQENAMAALLKLSKHANGRQLIMDSRGLGPIVNVLKFGRSLEARQASAATLFYLSSIKEYRKLIGENFDAIAALVEMIKEGTTCGKKNAVVAIFGLLLLPKNHQRVLTAGAVPALVGVLASSDKADLIVDVLAVLVALAESVEGSHAVLQAHALSLITKALQSATSRAAKEYCVSILVSLCVNVGTEVVNILVKDTSLMPMLYSILTDGTPHAAKKARSLINVLLEFNEKISSGLVGSSVSQQRLVHLS